MACRISVKIDKERQFNALLNGSTERRVFSKFIIAKEPDTWVTFCGPVTTKNCSFEGFSHKLSSTSLYCR